jgi:hypothetical protein
LKAVVIDFVDVKHVDLSGLVAMNEVMNYARKKDLYFFTMNVLPDIDTLLKKSHVYSDDIESVSPALGDAVRYALNMVGCAPRRELDTESLGGLQNLLNENQYASLPALRSLPSVIEYSDRDNETKSLKVDEVKTQVD